MTYHPPYISRMQNGKDPRAGIQIEMPAHYAVKRALRATIPYSQVQQLDGKNLWWVAREYYGPVCTILKHFFPSMIDATGWHRQEPSFPDGWSEKWETYLRRDFERKNASLTKEQGFRAVLCVTDAAPFELIQAAYRTLAKLYHPDNPSGNSEKFRAVDEAYKALQGGRGNVAVGGSHNGER